MYTYIMWGVDTITEGEADAETTLPFSNALQNVPHVNLTYYAAGSCFLVINLTLRNLSSGQLVKIFHFLNSTAMPRY